MSLRPLAQSLLIFGFLPGALPVRAQPVNHLRISQIQVIGTNNRYHTCFALNAEELWHARNPALFNSLDYRHLPLEQQA